MDRIAEFSLPESLFSELRRLVVDERNFDRVPGDDSWAHQAADVMCSYMCEALALWFERFVRPQPDGQLAADPDRLAPPRIPLDTLIDVRLPEGLLDDLYTVAWLDRLPDEPDGPTAASRIISEALSGWLIDSTYVAQDGVRRVNPSRQKPNRRPFDDLPEDPDQ